MSEKAQPDYFRWILGVLLIVASVPAVIAVTGSTDKPAPTAAPAPTVAPVSAAASAPARPLTAAQSQVTAATPQSTRAALPAGQVWQCVVNGQRIFSDSSCGEGATIRQLSDVNGMDPTPVARVSRYPGYAPTSGYGAPSGYAPPSAYGLPPTYYSGPEDEDAGSSNEIFATNQFIVINERRRHERWVHAHPHTHAHARAH